MVSITQDLIIEANKELDSLNYDAAIFKINEIFTLDPINTQAINLLSKICFIQNKKEEALKLVEMSFNINPKQENNIIKLAFNHIANANFDAAKEILLQGYQYFKNNPEINYGLIICSSKLNDKSTHIDQHIKAALLLEGKHRPQALNCVGLYFNQKHQYHKAIPLLKEAISLDSSYQAALINLAESYFGIGETDLAITTAHSAIKVNPEHILANDNLMMYAHYSNQISKEDILDLAKQFYQNTFSKSHREVLNKNWKKKKLTNLKLGLVSGDLRNHPTYYWISDLIKKLSTQIHITCFSNSFEDRFSEELKKYVSSWINVENINDLDLANLIQENDIDILIDLSGHTALNRLGVFAIKPAPVQITWLGQSGPIGIPQIDYMISDPNMCPTSDDNYYTEKVYRLPSFFAPYNPSLKSSSVEITEPPCIKKDYVTFGNFNNFIKIGKRVLETWAEILSEVSNSRLILMSNGLLDEQLKQKTLAIFKNKGIDEQRITLLKPCPRDEYLNKYNDIDIALDSFPVGGGTTSLETMQMSTPLISLYGDKISHRTGSSILKNISCEELIAYDLDEYIKKAIALAGDKNKIKEYKSTLKDKFLESDICNSEKFSKDFHKGLCEMYTEKIRNLEK